MTTSPSPCVRAADPRSKGAGEVGSTPEGAGSGLREFFSSRWNREHPPQVRGTVVGPLVPPVDLGNIPAGAGSSGSWRSPRCRRWEHPCGHGEHARITSYSLCPWGPSPRAPGATPGAAYREVELGIIHAGAGSSQLQSESTSLPVIHLRMRGERRYSTGVTFSSMDPSPRVRGAAASGEFVGEHGGSIPAGAGSRTRPPRSPRPSGVHPRGRGEQSAAYRVDPTTHVPEARAPSAAPSLEPTSETATFAPDSP